MALYPNIYNIYILACLVVIHSAKINPVTYKGDQLWRSSNSVVDGTSVLLDLLDSYSIDVWKSDASAVDFRVPQHLTALFKEELEVLNLEFKVLINDIGMFIEKEKESLISSAASRAGVFAFDTYHPFPEIVGFLNALSQTNEYVTLSEIGRTIQERPILMVKLSVSSGSTQPKPAVWLDCGVHAREWISPATCLWGLDYLLTNYGNDTLVTSFLDKFDIFMVPVLNPDGYVYTWVEDRLWRKNRNHYSGNACAGVDINRNFDLGNFGGVGASNNSCAETFHGPSAFSEKESQAVRDAVTQIQSSTTVAAFFCVHSYSQLWLFAYASKLELPTDVDELYRVSQVGVDAIKAVYGTEYTNGPHFTTIYPASGTSVDWGYNSGISNSFIVELRDTGEYGFLLPEDQITPTATEAWQGFIQSSLAI